MPVARHPLHRSVRAELLHTAPALGRDDQTLLRIGVTDVQVRQPALDQACHASPRKVMPLATSAQGSMPQPTHLETERTQPRAVPRHAECVFRSNVTADSGNVTGQSGDGDRSIPGT